MHGYCYTAIGREGVNPVGDQGVKCEPRGVILTVGGGGASEMTIETCDPI